ncbi:MAG: FtsW/RodA/SpoVE family cell cycle protein [Phycisphaerales bacterium]
MTRPGRFEWRHPGWLVLGATILLTLIGLHAITISRGLEHELLNSLAKKTTGIRDRRGSGAFVVMIPHYRWAAHLALPRRRGDRCVAGVRVDSCSCLRRSSVRATGRRWISMGFTDFQPSELAKIVFVIVVAQRWTPHEKAPRVPRPRRDRPAALVPIG